MEAVTQRLWNAFGVQGTLVNLVQSTDMAKQEKRVAVCTPRCSVFQGRKTAQVYELPGLCMSVTCYQPLMHAQMCPGKGNRPGEGSGAQAL